MEIYLISQSVNDDYDTYDSAIVIAESEEEAKKIHPDGNYDYKENNTLLRFNESDEDYGSWAKKEYIEVKLIGVANKDAIKGVVCSSYNAG